MILSIDIKRIIRDSCLVIRQDGLSDICAGLMLGMTAIFFLDFKYAGALIVGCSMQTIIVPACRKKVTYPRIGYAIFPGRADRRSTIIRGIAVPLVIVGLTIGAGIWLRRLLPLCLGTFLGGLALANACITGYILDYILAAVLLASGFTGLILVQLGYSPGVAAAYQFWKLAGILIPFGLIPLIRFIRKYPEN
jgi:hypothetical protein